MKRLISVILIAFMALSLFASGSSEKTAETKKMSTELNVLYSGTPQIEEKEYLLNVYFKNFEEKYGVKVNVDFVTQSDAITMVRTQQETGNITADIIFADTANMNPYIDGGWMEDITSLVDSTGVTYTTMFDSITNKDGVRYFVPNSFDVYILIANKKALEYLPQGLTEEDVVDGLSWDEYADWAIAIKKGTGEGKTMLPASSTGSQLLYPMGGMTLAYGGSFPEFNTDAAKAAFSILGRIAAEGAFYSEQNQYNAVTEPMSKGDAWLAFSHMSPAGTAYNAAPNSFIIGAAPHGTAGAGSTSGAWCYGIQKGAEHEDLAELFIKYIADPEVNYEFCYNYGGALSPIVEVGDVLTDEDVVMQAGINILKTAIVAGVPSTEYTDWNAVKLLFCSTFDEILKTGTCPSDEFLDSAQATLESLKK